MQPFHPGYAIILALPKGAGIEVQQFDYTADEEIKARATFKALVEIGGAISITLEGPGDIVLAEWEA
jgi:hypothetical protein